MRSFLKKNRTKMGNPKSLQKEGDFDMEHNRGHFREVSSGSLRFGPDVTLSISTDPSSEPSSFDGNLFASSSATTQPRRNVSKSNQLAPTPTTSESLEVSLVGPREAISSGRQKLKAEMQLAKKKLQQMANVPDPAPRATIHGRDISSDSNKMVASVKYIQKQEIDAIALLEGESFASTGSMPTESTCNAYAVDDLIQTGISVSTCGIFPDYRPIFGAYDDEVSYVTGITETSAKFGKIV